MYCSILYRPWGGWGLTTPALTTPRGCAFFWLRRISEEKCSDPEPSKTREGVLDPERTPNGTRIDPEWTSNELLEQSLGLQNLLRNSIILPIFTLISIFFTIFEFSFNRVFWWLGIRYVYAKKLSNHPQGSVY